MNDHYYIQRGESIYDLRFISSFYDYATILHYVVHVVYIVVMLVAVLAMINIVLCIDVMWHLVNCGLWWWWC